MRYVIAYDVRDNGNRTRLSNLLLDYGERVQKSVFEADLKKEEMRTIVARAEKLLEAGDSLRVYPVCENCSRNMELRGREAAALHLSFRIV